MVSFSGQSIGPLVPLLLVVDQRPMILEDRPQAKVTSCLLPAQGPRLFSPFFFRRASIRHITISGYYFLS